MKEAAGAARPAARTIITLTAFFIVISLALKKDFRQAKVSAVCLAYFTLYHSTEEAGFLTTRICFTYFWNPEPDSKWHYLVLVTAKIDVS